MECGITGIVFSKTRTAAVQKLEVFTLRSGLTHRDADVAVIGMRHHQTQIARGLRRYKRGLCQVDVFNGFQRHVVGIGR